VRAGLDPEGEAARNVPVPANTHEGDEKAPDPCGNDGGLPVLLFRENRNGREAFLAFAARALAAGLAAI